MGPSSPRKAGRTSVAALVSFGGAAAAAMAGHPDIAIGAAASQPVAAAGIDTTLDWLSERVRDRHGRLLKDAAKVAGIDGAELKRRCRANPEAEDLLLASLKLAGDTNNRAKLLCYAIALAQGIDPRATDEETQRLRSFVRTLGELDVVHIALLDRFTWLEERLFDTDHPNPDRQGLWPERIFSWRQIQVAMRDFENLGLLVGDLVRVQLIRVESRGGGAVLGGGGVTTFWMVTESGQVFLKWLWEISAIVEDRPELGFGD